MERSGSPAIYETRVDITLRIPTRSGITLGATLTRPRTDGHFPALVWYDPYRAAWSGHAGEMAHYFAQRGYLFVYLHPRGTGNSEGISLDEYRPEETQDGYDAIEWLAAQPWCNGAVGMLGSSYSGFTTLQVAALAPPSLKAIAPAYFTDRRYTDDCHYKGGCLRGYYDTLTYGLWMVAMNALPPHPQAVGERWAALWQERLQKNEPYLLPWLAHPVEDEYWAQGSIIGHYDQIKAAAFLIGGWHDGYPNPPLRTFRALHCPKKLLMGPWNHTYPHSSHCGPRIDIYFELLRWWDRWLKGIDNGVEKEPRVIIFVREFEPPLQDRNQIAGGWYAADELPHDAERIWYLGTGKLMEEASPDQGEDRFYYFPASARNGGIWSGGLPFTLPGDQRPDEIYALNYTSEPLPEDLVLCGQPSVTLTVSADVPVLPFAFRLTEVGEDGTSVLVTKGILNATRRYGMDCPQPLTPGETVLIQCELEATAWRFRKGNRIRLSIDGSDFPNVWPTPYAGTGTLHRGPNTRAELRLPLWTQPQSCPIALPPSESPPTSTGSGSDPAPWRVIHDVLEDRYHFVLSNGNEFVVNNRHPAIAYTRAKSTATAAWEGFRARAEADAVLQSDEKAFHITITLHVYVNDLLHFWRSWNQSTERVLM